MSTELPTPSSASRLTDDPWLRRGRELVAAVLALVVVIGTAILIANVFRFVSVNDTNDQSFQHAKDLVTIILPLLGVVLGYYFNKVSTENRAETAERSAQSATTNAQHATEARLHAEHETKETKESLKELSVAAEKVLTPDKSALDVLGDTASGDNVAQEARFELSAALERARRFIR
jgi:cytoskeletal protein RodZ